MSCIHYKFKSSLDYSTLTFDGLHLTLRELKRLIVLKQKLGTRPDFDLQITNAQTREVYKSDDELISKNASVIVSRAPVCTSSKALGTAVDVPPTPDTQATTTVDQRISFEQLSQTSDLAAANATEDDKIRAMMAQSTRDYDKSNYVKQKYPHGAPYSGYVCNTCGQPGHYRATCPNRGSETDVLRVKRSTGIPQSFMKVVENPKTQGAMMTTDGHYVVPLIDAEAYRRGKKEKPPFLEQDKPEAPPDERFIPGELLCNLCKDILKDAVVIQCCGNSYCDECIREKLLESEDHMCPQCKETGISPDSLIPNTFLRKLVMNFENETGYIKPRRRSSSSSGPTALTPPAVGQSRAPPNNWQQQQQQRRPYQHQHQKEPACQHHPTSQTSQQSLEYPPAPQPQPAPSQPLTNIPTHLIGLPPHVIKAQMREMEKNRAASSQPPRPAQSNSAPYPTQEHPPAHPQTYPARQPSQTPPGYTPMHTNMAPPQSGPSPRTNVSSDQPNTPTLDEPHRAPQYPGDSSSVPVATSSAPYTGVPPQGASRPPAYNNQGQAPPQCQAPLVPPGTGPSPGQTVPTSQAPSMGQGQPSQSQAQPPQGQAQPSQGQGQPPPGQPPQGLGQPPHGQGQPLQGQGQPPHGQGQPPLTGPLQNNSHPQPTQAQVAALMLAASVLAQKGQVPPELRQAVTAATQAATQAANRSPLLGPAIQGYGPAQPWPNAQPRPGFPGPGPHPGYGVRPGMPPGAMMPGPMPPRMPPNRPGLLPHPNARQPMAPHGGYRGPPPPAPPVNGPPGPPGPGRFPRPMLSKEQFYREKERLLRQKEEEKRRRAREDEERERLEQERLRKEQEKKRENDLNSMAQEFIDAKRTVKPETSKLRLTRSKSRSKSRPRSRSPYRKASSRSRSKSPKAGSRSPRPRSRSSRSRSPRGITPRTRSPRPRSPRPRSRSPRLRSRSPRPRSPRKRSYSPRPRSRSFTPRRRSHSRSWSRSPPRSPPGWSPRRSRSPGRKSWSRTPPRHAHRRSRSRTPEKRRVFNHGRESPPPHRRRDWSPNYGRYKSPPPKDKYKSHASSSKYADYHRNPELWDPRWAEYMRKYNEWYETYGEQYGYPSMPMGLPKELEPGPYTSRDGRRGSRSPSRPCKDDKRHRELNKRSVRDSSRHPKEPSKKRKLKGYRDDHMKDYSSDTEDRTKKPRSKKKRLTAEIKEEVYNSGRSSRENDTPPSSRHSLKDVKKKADSKKSRTSKRSTPSGVEMQQDGYISGGKSRSTRSNGSVSDKVKMVSDRRSSDDNMETNQESSDTEHIKTLSTKRGNNLNSSERPRDLNLIQINTQSFKDGMEDISSQDFVRSDKKTADVCSVESRLSNVKMEQTSIKMELEVQESSKSQLEENKDDSSFSREHENVKKNEVNSETKTSIKSEARSDVDSELDAAAKTKGLEKTKRSEETPGSLKTETEEVVTVKKPKESSKSKSKKSKDREKEVKLRKIEKLQAEIRRLEKQQEEGLMVAPPELSRWERDESEQDSDGKDLAKSRISSSISKPGLPRHVLESAEKAIMQKPRGVISVVSTVNTVPVRSTNNSSRRFIDRDRDRDRDHPPRERSPTSADLHDSRDPRYGRRVSADAKLMQVTISSKTDSKPRSTLQDKDPRPLLVRKEKDNDKRIIASDIKKYVDSDKEKDRVTRMKLQRVFSKEMPPPAKPVQTMNVDKQEARALERKLSVMDESAFEPDYEEDLNDEALATGAESTCSDRESGSSPLKKLTDKELKSSQKSSSRSRSTSPATSDKDKKHKHKKKKHKHKHDKHDKHDKHKKHKKQKSKDKERDKD